MAGTEFRTKNMDMSSPNLAFLRFLTDIIPQGPEVLLSFRKGIPYVKMRK
jgi:hypothetical protein